MPSTPGSSGSSPSTTSWRDLPIAQKRALATRLEERRREAVLQRFPTAGALAAHLDPTTANPPHLRLIDEALVDVLRGETERLLIVMPPQEGKSERTSHYGIEWLLMADPSLRIAIASYELETARRWGQVIRDDLRTHDLPLSLQPDSQAASRWNLDGYIGSVYCVGVGGALTGRPVDVLCIDDPIKDREQADSATYRDRVWNWWTDVARTRLAPGGRVILILTRWHDDDIAGRILALPSADEWRVLHIPAQADSDDDPLGRAHGEYLPSARGWPEGRWEAVRRDVGARTWSALYQGRPAPSDGDVWLRQWWQWYSVPFWASDGVSCWLPEGWALTQSWDLAFKDLHTSDYVVGQVWAAKGADRFLVDQVHDRLDFPGSVRAVEAMSRRWPQAREKLVEDKANGSAVIATLRSSVEGLIPVNPRGGKMSRAAAAAPVIEAGNVHLPSFQPWAAGLVDEAAAFPNGVHDDQVDAASQYLARPPRRRLLA